MPVIKGTNGWYTDEEIATMVPATHLAGGLRPNTPEFWHALCEPGRYTGDYQYFAVVLDALPHFGRWCDVGCGLGEFMVYVEPRRPDLEIWGWDTCAVAVEHARQRPTLDATRLAVGTLPDTIPWPDVEFDVVTCLEVVEHVPFSRARPVIEAMVSIAPRTIITVPNGMDFAGGHFVWYDLNLFRSMLPKGYVARGGVLPSKKHVMFIVEAPKP